MTSDSKQRARDLLRDIVEWGERCARHLNGVSHDHFLKDEKTRDAVSKCVEVVGTAAKGLMETSSGIEREHPELELQRAYATRIRLAHVYKQIDAEVLWITATRSVPKTVAAARQILARSSPEH